MTPPIRTKLKFQHVKQSKDIYQFGSETGEWSDEEPSRALPIYVVALSVNWHYNGESKVSTLDLTGIDLGEAGPKLLSRFA